MDVLLNMMALRLAVNPPLWEDRVSPGVSTAVLRDGLRWRVTGVRVPLTWDDVVCLNYSDDQEETPSR